MSTSERIPQRVLELSFHAKDPNDLLMVRAILVSLGIKNHEIIDDENIGAASLRFYPMDSLFAQKIRKLFIKLSLNGLKVKQQTLLPKDWLTLWKKNWKPAKLTRLLDVVPVWCQEKYKNVKGRDHILMDTVLSFGTGLHETTQIVSQMIEDHRGQIKSLFDIGTGTGILMMVAKKHGVPDVRGIDLEDLSIEAAKKNLKVNHLRAQVSKADINRFEHVRVYDFVAANLVTQDLIQYQKKIARFVAPGGFLAVSGISLENCPRFENNFKLSGFYLCQAIKAKEWAGYLFQKNK